MGRTAAYCWLIRAAMMVFAISANAQDEPHRAATDKIPPQITHQPSSSAVTDGDPFTISAEASDPSGIRLVRLWYRTDVVGEFHAIPMQRSERGSYEARFELTAEEISSRKVEYYFDATDQANNVATLGAALLPFTVTFDAPKATAGRREHTWKWILGAAATAAVACATKTGICKDGSDEPTTTNAIFENVPVPQP